MRMLKKVNRRKPLKIIQIRPLDLKDFHSIAQLGQYQCTFYLLPKRRVFCLNKTSPRYKTKFGEDWTEVTVIQFIRSRRSSDTEPYQVPDVPVAKGSGDLSQAKKNHIKAMLKFMPPDYKTFMSNIAL